MTEEEKARLMRKRKQKSYLDEDDSSILESMKVLTMDIDEQSMETPKKVDENSYILDIVAKNRTLEEENNFLKHQNERIQTELKEAKSTVDALIESNSAKSTIKIKEIETSLKSLLTQIREANEHATQKENNFLFQNSLLQSSFRKRDTLSQQNARLTERLLIANEKIKQLNNTITLHKNSLKVLYVLAMSIVNTFIQENNSLFVSSRISNKAFVKYIYRDLFALHSKYTEAAVRIQAWYRGIMTRRKLLREGKYIVKPQKIVSKKKKIKTIKREHSTHKEDLNSNIVFLVLERLWEATAAVEHDSKQMRSNANLVELIKAEVSKWFKAGISKEIEAMKAGMEKSKTEILKYIYDATHKEFTTRGCQTLDVQQSSRSIQCGTSSISSVEIR